MDLAGILAPAVTPFDTAGELDEGAFTANLRAHLDAGVRGIVVAGSNGEAPLLDERERARLVELARAVMPDDRPLLAGAGGESTRMVIARARAAAERGASGVLVVAPHYYGDAMTSAVLREHYERIADASPIPVLIYTIPKYMHFAMPVEVVAELSRHGNIVGMKDSAGDAALFARYMESQRDEFSVLTGSAALLSEALRLGARGAILAVSLFAPRTAFDVWNAVRASGEGHGLEEAQALLTPLGSRIVGALGVAGVKAAMDTVGLHGGAPRPPLRPLGAEQRAEVRALLKTVDLAPTG